MRLTSEQLRKIYNEEDMLKGNINRMCIIDDFVELKSMYGWAIQRLQTIMQINAERLRSEENEQND